MQGHNAQPRNEPGPELNRLAERVIGAAIEVHRVLGPGYAENVYEEALCLELAARDVPFVRQPQVEVQYKGHAVGRARLDLLVADEIVVELKAVEALNDTFKAQVISYLRATGHELGLLINFNVPVLRDGIRRLVLSTGSASSALSAPLR